MEEKFEMRIYWKVQGGHTHLRIFIGRKGAGSYGCAGQIIVRNEEFEAWKDARLEVEFRAEDE